MDPCPFVRLTIDSLALRLPETATNKQIGGEVHPSSTPCYCKLRIKHFPSQKALLPLSSFSDASSPPESSTSAPGFHLDADAIRRISGKKISLRVSVYAGRTGHTCGVASGKLLGKVEVAVDLAAALSRTVAFHNGWKKLGGDGDKPSARLHLLVCAEPDPRFVFQFGGEPECSPVVYQIQDNLKQPVFSCKFSSDRNGRSRSLPSGFTYSSRGWITSSSFKRLKSSSIFGDSLRLAPKSQLKATKAKSNGASTVTKCEIGQSLEEFLAQATPDKGLRTLLMCMGEALRTIAFKVRTASCGGTACVNSFGDEQLAVDMLADKLLFEALQYSHVCKYACSEEVPELQDMGGPVEGGFSVAFDPLDGSSIVDTNFTVGTIFGVWPGDKLTGITGGDQVAAAMGIYGPRTTYVLAVKGFPGTHEFLLLDEGKWQHVKETTEIAEGKMFSPGNLRATFDNSEYSKLIDYYVKEKYTLRYTGGMVPDVNQIIVKEKGIFTNVTSPTAKAKLRLLFEVAPLGLLIENAGGFSSDGHKSVLDKTIINLDDRTQVAYGSKNEIIRFEETLYGTSRLKNVPIGVTA